jgi:hypothetical protein
MADVQALDRAFHVIMTQLVETGRAPHYAELAGALNCTAEQARQTVHEIFKAGYPGWVHPGTDLIVSFPPLSNLPTQYRVSVDGEQRWHAQCGFEALAVCWLFPGRAVRVEAPCLDCAEPMQVEMRDGQFLRVEPPELTGHCNSPWSLLATPGSLPHM